jgi:hypothetical protein
MRSIITLAAALAFAAGPALAGNKNTNKEADDAADVSEDAATPVDPAASASAAGQNDDFCFYAALPTGNAQFKVVRKLKVAKGTYGGVADLIPQLRDAARRRGGEAIIDYDGAQHFGFWPWRMVRPIVHGTAIKWGPSGAPDCKASGGMPMSAILASNEAPPKSNEAPANSK